jgi:hypothetical protein
MAASTMVLQVTLEPGIRPAIVRAAPALALPPTRPPLILIAPAATSETVPGGAASSSEWFVTTLR